MKVVRLILLFSLMAGSSVVYSQGEDDLIRFFQMGAEDGSKLVTAYVGPVVEGFSYALNGGWFHTAKPHKLGGFDINISVTPVFIPKSRDYFDPNTLGLSSNVVAFRNESSNNNLAPSIIGPGDETEYDYNTGNGIVTISGPKGLGIRKSLKVAPVGLPMVQVGVGLIKGTDIMVRYAPKTNISSTDLQLFGLAVRHDVKQHIPGIKMLPFDLSVLAGFTSFKGVTDMSGIASEFPPATSDSRQETVYKFNAFLLEALISKKLAFLTFFGGVGYNGINTKANINGSYTFFIGQPYEFELNNPYSAKFKNNSMRLDVGMRINLMAFYLYGNYSIQEFQAFTFGLGFTFR
ncbi:MAG: hypothetical protein N2044_02895 [Cyclobacteriaceae bacterium]|nr:hypothetical protein [Cyclobacteriaceae bacterium]